MPPPSPTNGDFFDQMRAAVSGAAGPQAAAPQSAPSADSPAGASGADFFDSLKQQVAAPSQKQSHPTIGQELSAPFQAAASLATGALAPVGASIENLVTGHTSPADYAAARAKWQYTPSNPVAQMDINALSWLPRNTIGKVTGALGDLAQSHGLMSSQEAQDALNTGLLAATPGVLRGGEAPVAAGESANPLLSSARALGLKFTPDQVDASLPLRAAQGIAGSAKVERIMSRANAPQVNAAVAQDLGLPNVKPQTLVSAKAAPNAVYKAAAGAGTVALKPEDFGAVNAPGTLKDAQVQALREHYANMPSIDARDLVADVRQLRADAGKNIKAPYAPAQNALGWAQQHTADGLEQALDRHLQRMGTNAPISLSDLQQARVQLAKIHSAQTALKGNNIVPQLLAKQGPRLTGNMRTIADAYTQYDRSLQNASRLRDAVPFDFGDVALGIMGGLHDPAAALLGLGRPLARVALASKPIQNLIAGPVARGAAAAPRMGTGLLGQLPTTFRALNLAAPQPPQRLLP